MTHRRTLLRRPGVLSLVACAGLAAASLAACGPAAETPILQQSATAPPSVVSVSPSADAGPSGSPSASASPSASTGDEASGTTPILGADAWTADPADKDASPGSEGLIFHDLRIAQHDGFTRVVVEFAGSGDPGWYVGWVDEPREQGRGLPLDVDGAAFLDLAITGTVWPQTDQDQALYYAGPTHVAAGAIDVVEDGTFEDQTHLALGMDRQRDVQIGTLTDPVRVVVDIRD